MDTRIVQGFPLSLLWRDGKDIPSQRLRDLVRDEAEPLIMDRHAQIVIAQAGAPLLWIQPEENAGFWRGTPKSAYFHTISFHGQSLDKAIKPNYLFYPSEWEPIGGSPLILLEGIFWPYGVAIPVD